MQDVPKRIFHSFDEKRELLINQKFRSLNTLGCDYLYYLVSDNSSEYKSYRFCTHENWIDFYYEENFIANDPLKRIMENSSHAVLPWSQISHTDRNEKRTMLGRADFGLHNGLSIVSTYNNQKHIFVMATENQDHDLTRYLLLEKCNDLAKLMKSYITGFDNYSQRVVA